MPEPDTPNLKTLDIHADYVMHGLMHHLRTELHLLIAYMQRRTPYGDAYKKAFEKNGEIAAKFDELESLLQDCVEAAQKEKKK